MDLLMLLLLFGGIGLVQLWIQWCFCQTEADE